MSRHQQTPNDDWVDDDWQDAANFEKISRRDRATLPVSSQRRVARSSKETPGSKRVRRQISLKTGGMHRRRHRKID